MIDGPRLDPRTAGDLMEVLRDRHLAYVPGWRMDDDAPATEVARAYARFLAALAERLNKAPGRAKLAFLDQLGIDQMPAQAARAPVVFTPIPGLRSARAPRGTPLSAPPPPGVDDRLPFETEREIVIADSTLAEVRTVLPGEDRVADHTAAIRGGHPTVLFEGAVPIEHHLYIAHSTALAIAGDATVELHLQLLGVADEPLTIRWTFWDGDAWRPFQNADEVPHDTPPEKTPFDATRGLTRSGLIRLHADCGTSKQRRVDGRQSSWIRGELTDPFPPRAGGGIPAIDLLDLNTVITRTARFTPTGAGMPSGPLPRGGTVSDGIAPDEAFGVGQAIDLSKLAYPFGQQPSIDAAFYIRSDEVFSKPGAAAKVWIVRAETPNDAMNATTAKYQKQVAKAQVLVTKLTDAVDTLRVQLTALNGPGGPLSFGGRGSIQEAVLPSLEALLAGVAGCRIAALDLHARLKAHATTVNAVADDAAAVATPAILARAAEAVAGIAEAADALVEGRNVFPWFFTNLTNAVGRLRQAALTVRKNAPAAAAAARTYLVGPDVTELLTALRDVADGLDDWRDRRIETPTDLVKVDAARQSVNVAIGHLDAVLGALRLAKPVTIAMAMKVPPPEVPPAELAWEYWDGRTWRELIVAQDPAVDPKPPSVARVKDLDESGAVEFEVPDGWQPCEVGGTVARWLRMRIVRGAYAVLRTVSWLDADTGAVNFLPILEPRPPALGDLKLAYSYSSPRVRADHVVALNDFAWTDGTEPVRWRGTGFPPFTPTGDTHPTLYMRFDRPLPAGLVSLFADIEELDGVVRGPQLDWEYWDGGAWAPLTVEDETRGFVRPGMLGLLWQGVEAPLQRRVVAAEDVLVTLMDAASAAGFRAGDGVYLRVGEEGRAATVAAVEGADLRLAAPLEAPMVGGTVERMSKARFGVPGYWVRSRVVAGAEPRAAAVSTLLLNATWASQRGTVRGEAVGSTDGRAGQTFFASRGAVLDQTLEVRELSGRRAELDLEPLRRELEAAGRGDAIREVRDDRTGRVLEAWVAWRSQPTLYFSGQGDRDYVAQRNLGRLTLGDGRRGMLPPPGSDNVRLREYRHGGGAAGDVAAGAIDAILSGALAQGVTNPQAASGGAEAESEAAVEARGPLLLRHRRQAVGPADYEQLAREASLAVARARALRDEAGGPGAVTLAVLPQSKAPRPVPSAELRRRVRDFVMRRCPASLRAEVVVTGPTFEPVGAIVAVAPRRIEQGGELHRRVLERLLGFLHPVTGGPDGQGWAFGQDLFASDLASALSGLPELDHIDALQVVAHGSATGTSVAVADDRIVAAGDVRVSLVGTEG